MAYWNTTSVQTFFLSHDKLITWLSALKGIIAAFCSANFVCDENNSIRFCHILPIHRYISYRFLLIRNPIQITFV